MMIGMLKRPIWSQLIHTPFLPRIEQALKGGGCASSASFQMGNDPKLKPSSANIQSAVTITYPFTKGTETNTGITCFTFLPLLQGRIPCNSNNHMFASCIAFPIGHRSLIRLFVGRCALGQVPTITHKTQHVDI